MTIKDIEYNIYLLYRNFIILLGNNTYFKGSYLNELFAATKTTNVMWDGSFYCLPNSLMCKTIDETTIQKQFSFEKLGIPKELGEI